MLAEVCGRNDTKVSEHYRSWSLVPAARLELARLAAADFESASTLQHWRGLRLGFFRIGSADWPDSALGPAVFAEAVSAPS